MAEDIKQFIRRIQQQSRMIETAIERLRLMNKRHEHSDDKKSPLAPTDTRDNSSEDKGMTAAEPTDV
jgi:hypothetical protein